MLKAQNRKTKTNTNPDDPNWYMRRCPDPNARMQKKDTESEEELQIKTEEDVSNRLQRAVICKQNVKCHNL